MCMGLQFYPCSFPQTSFPLSLPVADSEVMGVLGAQPGAACEGFTAGPSH